MNGLYVFNRQCAFSEVSRNKSRPDWFSREKCFNRILVEANESNNYLRVVYDEARGLITSIPYLFNNSFNNSFGGIVINDGTESGAYIKLIKYILSCNLSDNDIVYIVEDDYLHREGWSKILEEGIQLIDEKFEGRGFVTLYCHPDKYDESVYPNLVSMIFTSARSYWRTTPSTTNTFACRFKALKETMEFQIKYSSNTLISRDHDRFIDLWRNGYALLSCMPSYATHVETEYLGKVVDWELIAK